MKKSMLFGQRRNKLKDGVTPLRMLIGSMEGSVRGSDSWSIFAFL